MTAAVIASDDGPTQSPVVSVEITEEYADSVDCSSVASPSQAAAAARIDPDPGPVYIRPELNSGGNAA